MSLLSVITKCEGELILGSELGHWYPAPRREFCGVPADLPGLVQFKSCKILTVRFRTLENVRLGLGPMKITRTLRWFFLPVDIVSNFVFLSFPASYFLTLERRQGTTTVWVDLRPVSAVETMPAQWMKTMK